jgi:hypothetical protein
VTHSVVRARVQLQPGSGGLSLADAVAKAEEFALDAPVPPPRVLSGQPLDQLTDLIRDRWASGGVRVSPFALDQAPVPGEQGARGHDPVEPQARGTAAGPRRRSRRGRPSPA